MCQVRKWIRLDARAGFVKLCRISTPWVRFKVNLVGRALARRAQRVVRVDVRTAQLEEARPDDVEVKVIIIRTNFSG